MSVRSVNKRRSSLPFVYIVRVTYRPTSDGGVCLGVWRVTIGHGGYMRTSSVDTSQGVGREGLIVVGKACLKRNSPKYDNVFKCF